MLSLGLKGALNPIWFRVRGLAASEFELEGLPRSPRVKSPTSLSSKASEHLEGPEHLISLSKYADNARSDPRH